MTLTPEGIALIKSFEGLRLRAYLCSAGVPTIGYGSTRMKGRSVQLGDEITREEADALLQSDLNIFSEGVRRRLTCRLTPSQFSAVVAFAYNVGLGNLSRSTLLRRINEGNAEETRREWLKWTRAGGQVLPGLVRRRQAELKLFEKQ